MEAQLKALGLKYVRVEGVDSAALCKEYVDVFGTKCDKQTDQAYSVGQSACAISHIKAVWTAYKLGLCRALVIEDDTLLPFRLDYEALEESLPSEWAIAQLYTITHHDGMSIKNYFKSYVDSGELWVKWNSEKPLVGAQGYYLNREGMKQVVEATVGLKAKEFDNKWYMKQFHGVPSDHLVYALAPTYTSKFALVHMVSSAMLHSTIARTGTHHRYLDEAYSAWEEVFSAPQNVWPDAIAAINPYVCQYMNCPKNWGVHSKGSDRRQTTQGGVTRARRLLRELWASVTTEQ